MYGKIIVLNWGIIPKNKDRKVFFITQSVKPTTFRWWDVSDHEIYILLIILFLGKTFNADINNALNIMRKSSVVDMNILYGRGEVDTPIRIRIA